VSDDEFVATRDGFRLFARRSGRGARSLVLPGIGAEMDFAPLCAKTGLAMSDPVAFARSWRRIVAPTRMVNPTAFENLEADPSIWPNEWPEHMNHALNRVAAPHPVDYDYRSEAGRIPRRRWSSTAIVTASRSWHPKHGPARSRLPASWFCPRSATSPMPKRRQRSSMPCKPSSTVIGPRTPWRSRRRQVRRSNAPQSRKGNVRAFRTYGPSHRDSQRHTATDSRRSVKCSTSAQAELRGRSLP